MTHERKDVWDGDALLPLEALDAWSVPDMPENMKERVMSQLDETWRVGTTGHPGASPDKSRASTIALLTAVAAAAAAAAAVLLVVRPEAEPTGPRNDAVVTAPAPRGHLTLEVDPPDAVVELDGVALQGPSPFVATELSVGSHELRVHHEGHVAWTRVVHVPSSQLHLPIKLLQEADTTLSPLDCILAPELPQCQKKATVPASDPDLAETLTQAEIKAGVDAVLPEARACGPEHDAPAGETVRVRFSIEGATGKVSSSSAQAPHADTPLGRCVAAALERAEFPRFSRSGMGAVYPIRL